MIDIKNAVKAVHQYLESIQSLMGNPLNNLRLEEVELSDDNKFWIITLGYDKPEKDNPPLKSINLDWFSFPVREYKLFRVNSETGEVEAMKIRQV